MNRSSFRAAAGAIAVAALLSGCSAPNAVTEFFDSKVVDVFQSPGTCDDLVASGILATVGVEPMEAVPVPYPDWDGARLWPRQYAVEQAGGLHCEWYGKGDNDSVSHLTVQILPSVDGTTESFDDFTNVTEFGPVCENPTQERIDCRSEVITENALWVKTSLDGIPENKSGVRFARFATEVESAANSLYLPEVEDRGDLIGATCTDVIDLPALAAARDIDIGTLNGGDIHPGFGFDGAVTALAGASSCGYSEYLPDDEWGVIDLHWLSGGAWAMSPEEGSQQIVVAGLAEGDEVWVLPQADSYAIEMSIDGNWVVLIVLSRYEGGAVEGPALIEIIENVAANVRG